MEDRKINKNEEIEIDLSRLLRAVLSRTGLVAAVSIACAVAALLCSVFFITPRYQSSATFYIHNSDRQESGTASGLSFDDITASRSLVQTCIVILDARATLRDVISMADVDRTCDQLREMIDARSVDDTEILCVDVSAPDPREAERIANAIACILPRRIAEIVEGTSVKVVDTAVVAAWPSSPGYTQNTLLGFVFGFVMTVVILAARELFDITICSQADAEQVCDYPVLAAVPDMTAPAGGGYYRSYGKKKQRTPTADQKIPLIGADISFSAAEAYKLLRTKLQYSFAGEGSCRVIGISGAMVGEGKSLTAVNLACALSQLDKRVLLIDCDLRCPSLAQKLPIAAKPGLSAFLSGQSDLENLIQLCALNEGKLTFHVIPAGRNPPNPVELLGSSRMAKLLGKLREGYDYILLDLPPIGKVSDALVVAKETDGILLAVRRKVCKRPALTAAVRQIEFVRARLLGLVYNCAEQPLADEESEESPEPATV